MADFIDDHPEQDKPGPIDDDAVLELLTLLKKAMERNPEDEDQTALVDAIQQNRTFLLKYAMQSYLKKPTNAHLLEGVTSLIAQIEKTVRDDRKEKAKKKEGESNQLSFNQLLEAMKNISQGNITLPVFESSFFLLDPNKSLVEGLDIKPISKDELVEGNQLVGLDGEPI